MQTPMAAAQPAPVKTEKASKASALFSLNEAAAFDAGISPVIETTAAYVGRIKSAKYTTSKVKSSAGLAIEFESHGEQNAWLEIWYASNDGNVLKTGNAMINAIMYLTGLPELTAQQVGNDWIVPELQNVEIGMLLQRENYKKADQSQGYRMNLRQVFAPTSKHTAAEVIEGKDATAVAELLALLNQQ